MSGKWQEFYCGKRGKYSKLLAPVSATPTVVSAGKWFELPDFISWGTGYESVYYGIWDITLPQPERAHRALQNPQAWWDLGQY